MLLENILENPNLCISKVDLCTLLDILVESGLGGSWGWKIHSSFTFLLSLGFVPHNYNSDLPSSHGNTFPHTVLRNREVFSDPPYSGRVL